MFSYNTKQKTTSAKMTEVAKVQSKLSVGFFACEKLDYEQCTDHKYKCDGQSDKPALNKACDNVADEGNSCNGKCIGQLCRNMVDVVALTACRSHNGGIRNG